MSARLQYRNKCYCANQTACCNHLRQNPTIIKTTTATNSVSSTSTFKKKPTLPTHKFVKIRRTSNAAPTVARGLGHSHTSNYDYSRGNSAATTTTLTFESGSSGSNATRFLSNSRNTRKQASAVPASALSSPPPITSKLHAFTEQRQEYERYKEFQQAFAPKRAIAAELLENYVSNAAAVDDSSNLDESRFYALQNFRLRNLNDCFSVHRQQDLKLQQDFCLHAASGQNEANRLARDNYPAVGVGSEKLRKNEQNKAKLSELTPYSVRQKLLQLRLEAQAHGDVKLKRKACDLMEKSLALRFQETY